MREIALDTETTGLYANGGDKITEIGCVEIIDKRVTGRSFHAYINPEREVSYKAQEISGLSYDFLKKFPIFKDVYREFIEFIANDRLVIHNAPFDMGFLNMEVLAIGEEPIPKDRVLDTLVLARQKFPGAQATLDALCRRFSIDSSMRTKHGALIDAELLADVYIQMSVEFNQKDIFSGDFMQKDSGFNVATTVTERNFRVHDDELQKHREFLKKIKNPLWERI